MQQKKLLFVGYGDIARRASDVFSAGGCSVTGIARSDKPVPAGVNYWRGAITSAPILQQLEQSAFDVVVVTLTPAGRRADDYRAAYIDASRELIQLWEGQASRPGLVLYISSTSVYGQHQGEWVDEQSPTEPQSATAQQLLMAENLWRNCSLTTCVLRFAGIYGPGRDHLQRQVLAGNGGPRHNSPYTNRIHIDDCVGVIEYLCQRHWQGEQLEPLYLASDCEPAPGWQVRSYLAQLLRLPSDHLQETPASGRGGNKRCCNKRLLDSGYKFKYPDYRAGLAALLA